MMREGGASGIMGGIAGAAAGWMPMLVGWLASRLCCSTTCMRCQGVSASSSHEGAWLAGKQLCRISRHVMPGTRSLSAGLLAVLAPAGDCRTASAPQPPTACRRSDAGAQTLTSVARRTVSVRSPMRMPLSPAQATSVTPGSMYTTNP